MNPATLRFQVNLQKETKIPDGLGGFDTTWVSVFSNVWADITQPSGSDTFKYGKMLEQISTKVVIRHNKVIRNGWRVLYGTKIYMVKYVLDPNMERKQSILFCEELI